MPWSGRPSASPHERQLHLHPDGAPVATNELLLERVAVADQVRDHWAVKQVVLGVAGDLARRPVHLEEPAVEVVSAMPIGASSNALRKRTSSRGSAPVPVPIARSIVSDQRWLCGRISAASVGFPARAVAATPRRAGAAADPCSGCAGGCQRTFAGGRAERLPGRRVDHAGHGQERGELVRPHRPLRAHVEVAVHAHVLPCGQQVLLRPDDEVALAPCARAWARRGSGTAAATSGSKSRASAFQPPARRRLPAPPAHAAAPRSATASWRKRCDLRALGDVVGLPERADRRARRASCRGRCARRPRRRSTPIAFQYICGRLYWAPPGPKKTE